jgi:hypothetical protein
MFKSKLLVCKCDNFRGFPLYLHMYFCYIALKYATADSLNTSAYRYTQILTEFRTPIEIFIPRKRVWNSVHDCNSRAPLAIVNVSVRAIADDLLRTVVRHANTCMEDTPVIADVVISPHNARDTARCDSSITGLIFCAPPRGRRPVRACWSYKDMIHQICWTVVGIQFVLWLQ